MLEDIFLQQRTTWSGYHSNS